VDSHRYGRTCPACGGPLVVGEGGAGCVLCGHAIQHVRAKRRSVRTWRSTRADRELQLALPTFGQSNAYQGASPALASSALNHSGNYNTGRHQASQSTHTPPTLGSEGEIRGSADNPAGYGRADHNPDKQNRSRAA
jgi:hypothetical protein